MSKQLFFGLSLAFFTIFPSTETLPRNEPGSFLSAQEHSITATSTINWKSGYIDSTITLDAQKRNISLPTGRDAAQQILEIESPNALKDTFCSVLVNSSERLGNAVESGEIPLAGLNGIIDTGIRTPPFFSRDLKTISMTHTVSLAKLGSLFVTHIIAYEPKIPLETVPTRPYTGILIDARGLLSVHGENSKESIVPCLFPRIWNTSFDLLYEKNMVKPEIAIKKGIIHYSASTDESEYRDIIGLEPLRISAREVFGQNRTDPVISNYDYLKILSNADNRKLLLEGKIVILCDEDALIPMNLGPEKDDNYYFVWREINDKMEQKPVARTNFQDSWDGLKITMYDIRFKADTAQILPEEKNRLDTIADALRLAGKDAHYLIEGHTASVGKPSGELSLSVERAKKIADELILRGIPKDKIESTGYGGTKPVATNDTDEGRAKNRRVEILITLTEKPAD